MKNEKENINVKKIRQYAGIAVTVLAIASLAVAQETKYSVSTTAADPAVTFGPGQGKTVVTAVSASSDVANGAIKFYGRTGKYAPATVPGASATNVLITNTGIAITNSDKIVYLHKDGTAEYRTIVLGDLTNIVLSSAITGAGTNGDYVYDLVQIGQMVVGDSLTYAGTNAILNVSGYTVLVTEGDSPLYVSLDGMTNSSLQVTITK